MPAFDPIRIEACGVAAIREEEGWHRYFTEHAITPLAITYEQLDTDYERTMRDALQHLGFDGVGPGPRPTRRQSDAVNEQWMDRFHAET